MPTFSTPGPIAVHLELAAGEVRLVAGDRVDTVVEVRPADPSAGADVRAAEETRVDFSGGGLRVKAPRQRGPGLFGKVGAVEVVVELPAGSSLHGVGAMARFSSAGRLGACRIKTGMGDIALDAAGALDLDTGYGAVDVARVHGDADVRTGSGKVRLHRVEGAAVVKTGNGDVRIGEVTGDVRVKSANGDISLEQGGATIVVATANGDVRVGSAGRGSVALASACGRLDIGIPAGTAARLDVQTGGGRFHNHLDSVDAPEPSDVTIDVRARTGYGDITVRRAPSTVPSGKSL
jgi:hypothetical protein